VIVVFGVERGEIAAGDLDELTRLGGCECGQGENQAEMVAAEL
jgi:hypothetical protein